MTRRRSAVVTIVGSNYLSRASVLHASVRQWQPDWDFVTVVVDIDRADEVQAADVGQVRTPEELGLGAERLTVMGFLYNITEFCTAIKPAALLHLLNQGYDDVLYIDPDTRLYQPMAEVTDLLQKHDVVLTPHTLAPIPDDGLDPTHDNIRACGGFNLGFFAGNRGSRPLLDWWGRMLVLGAGIEIELNRFTDQRWMDLAPHYADVAVLRHRGYNVAYWNLHERDLRDGDGGYRVDDDPLVLFHFSGYQPSAPWQFSKFIARRPRVRLADSTVLTDLCDAYRTDLRIWSESAEHAALERRPYRRGELPLLRSPGHHTRSALRTMMREERIDGLEPMRGHTVAGAQQVLQDWLLTPPVAAPSSGIPRLLWATWLSRVDLQTAYPHPHGLSRDALLAWAADSGPAEEALPGDIASVVRANEETAAAAGVARITPGDATVVGLLESQSEVGDAGRRLADAFAQSGIGTHAVTSLLTQADRQPGLHHDDPATVGDATIWCVDGAQLAAVRESVPQVAAAGLVDVAYWWGEHDVPDNAAPVDEIWAPSRFIYENLSAPHGTTVELAPLVLDPDPQCSSRTRAEFGLPETTTVFLTRLDFLDSTARQNVEAVVKAFRAAFPRPGTAFLLVKTRHGVYRPELLDQLAWRVRDRSDIRVWDTTLPAAEDHALTRASDCFVSLHRAVGLGPDIAEAMALQRVTIATAYSGNLDFCTTQTTHLVPFRTVRVSDPSGTYTTEGTWAEPDVAEAARAMATVAGDDDGAERMGIAARTRIEEVNDPQSFAEFARRRLDALRARPRAFAGAQPVVSRGSAPPSVEPAPIVGGNMPVHLPPVESVLSYGRADAGPVRRLVRRAVFTLTKGNLYYSRNVVEAALQQIGVATVPVHRVVTTTRTARTPDNGADPVPQARPITVMQPLEANEDVWVIRGAAEPDVLACGHSHVISLYRAMKHGLLDSSLRAAVAYTRDPRGLQLGDPQYWDFVVDRARDRDVVVVWNGNQHNASFLVESRPPLRLANAELDAVAGTGVTIVPEEMLRAYWRATNDELEQVLGRLTDVANRVLVLGTPPPKPDVLVAQMVHSEPLFVSIAHRLGVNPRSAAITPGPTRLALWRVIQDMLAESAAATGTTFLPVPVAAFQDDGYLRPDLSMSDATHGNAAYGLLAWRAVQDTLREMT